MSNSALSALVVQFFLNHKRHKSKKTMTNISVFSVPRDFYFLWHKNKTLLIHNKFNNIPRCTLELGCIFISCIRD